MGAAYAQSAGYHPGASMDAVSEPPQPSRGASRRSERDLTGMMLGAASLITAAALARRERSDLEIGLFRLVNGLPGRAYRTAWFPMQYGTFGAVPALALLAFASRRSRLAVGLAVGGTAAWFLAKAAKTLVNRGRPASFIDGVAQRGTEEGDQGFPSGHAAVSAALTVIAWPQIRSGGRVTA